MRRVTGLLLVAALAASVAPAPSAAIGAAGLAAPDAFEAFGDDTPDRARALVAPGPGEAALEESHTIHVADAAAADEDWVAFDVSALQADAGYVYLIEAVPAGEGTPPVLEVYATAASPAPAGALPLTLDPAASDAASSAPWASGGGASLCFVPSPGVSATYRVRVRPWNEGGAVGFTRSAPAYRLRLKAGLATRIAGVDRAATAVAASRERFPVDGGVRRVVVAAGHSFADALAGSTLSGVLGGPLLLTARDRLSPVTARELARLGADEVYLLGGTAAVGSGVERSIAGMGITVTRVWGRTRYETAAEVARRAAALAGPTGMSTLAFVVSGEKFADATCASAPAAWSRAPVLLASRVGLPDATVAALRDPSLAITDAVIVGGALAVPAAAEESLKDVLGDGHVSRIAGSDRYQTSAVFARWATAGRTGVGSVGTSLSPAALRALAGARVGVASGASFADALGGGVFCGLAGAPLLLCEPGRVSPWIFAGYDPADAVNSGDDFVGSARLGRSWVFGGAGAMSAQAFSDLDLLTLR